MSDFRSNSQHPTTQDAFRNLSSQAISQTNKIRTLCVYDTGIIFFKKRFMLFFKYVGGVHRCVQVLSEVRAARSSGAGVTGSCLLHDMTAGVRE